MFVKIFEIFSEKKKLFLFLFIFIFFLINNTKKFYFSNKF